VNSVTVVMIRLTRVELLANERIASTQRLGDCQLFRSYSRFMNDTLPFTQPAPGLIITNRCPTCQIQYDAAMVVGWGTLNVGDIWKEALGKAVPDELTDV
jgi:hypothetical protein